MKVLLIGLTYMKYSQKVNNHTLEGNLDRQEKDSGSR
jgi:hypothetical protein